MGKRSRRKKSKIEEEPKEIKPLPIPLWDRHPGLVAAGLLVLMFIAFYHPIIFGGRTLLPPDTVSAKTFRPFIDNAISRGVYPLWNPYIFCGMPSFASFSAPFADLINDVSWLVIRILRWIVPVENYMNAQVILQFFVNFLILGGTVYLLLRSFRIHPGAALFSGVAMVFLPQVAAYSAFGHFTKLATVALIPLIFLLVEKLLEKRNLLYFSLTGLAIGVQLLRGHVQICFYTLLMVGIYLIYWMVVEWRREKSGIRPLSGLALVAGAVLAGMLVSTVLNVSAWEFSKYTLRGGGETGGLNYDYATDWSFSPSELITYLIPSFQGFGGETYWGAKPFTDFPLYFGLTVFILAMIAVFLRRDRMTWFLALFSVVVLFISFGKHLPLLYGPMFKFFPFFNKFRAPDMIQILLEFCMVILAGFGLQYVIDCAGKKEEAQNKGFRRIFIVFGGVLFILLVILLAGRNLYLGWAVKAGESRLDAYNKAVGDGFRALLLFVLTAGALMLTLRGKMRKELLPFFLTLVIFADFWIVNARFVKPQAGIEEEKIFAKTPEVTFLESQKGLFRILPFADYRTPNWYMYYFIQNVWGYHGAKLRLFQEVADQFMLSNGLPQAYLKVENDRISLREPSERTDVLMRANRAFFRMMNIRFLPSRFNMSDMDSSFVLVFPPQQQGGTAVFEYRDHLSRVFFPEKVMVMKDRDAILGFLKSGEFDPEEEAVIEEDPPFQIVAGDSNSAEILKYDLHRIDIKADIRTPACMVLSEVYYPGGWEAFVDGRKVPIYKTDYILRSVFLEKGEREVSFLFRPKIFRIGLFVSLGSLAMLILGAVLGLRHERKKKESRAEPES